MISSLLALGEDMEVSENSVSKFFRDALEVVDKAKLDQDIETVRRFIHQKKADNLKLALVTVMSPKTLRTAYNFCKLLLNSCLT